MLVSQNVLIAVLFYINCVFLRLFLLFVFVCVFVNYFICFPFLKKRGRTDRYGGR